METKKCSKCKEEKLFSEFAIDRSKKDGHKYQCKPCINLHNATRASYRKVYYSSRRGFYNNYYNHYFKELRDTNKLFRLKCNLRCRIYRGFKNNNHTKNSKTQDILGVSFKEFQDYVGIYTSDDHLDHIVPLSWASSEEDLYLLNHYSNFQVLTSIDNMLKGDRFVRRDNANIVLSLHPEWEKIKLILDRNVDKITD